MKELRKLRIDKEMSLNEVAREIGVDLSTLSRIERGVHFPKRKTAEKLADFYSISLGEIFDMLPQANAKVAPTKASI
ncbi:helix-turn-helix domain-containing protein [Vibrio coralliilyticus]|uniref:helix-turn-helix domain-containing protein n=1 Tax=Vibrio coralliilyticus TaxID=190893 RepID=UPI001851B260|nr:helix-turn-helix transcriptional regulator [Vibrio coralliilyticus]NUW66925.1 helix-turn-helix transcriptional regulator [Vibrio coralliilyticus]NUW70895.1 helix-turn-helix transcriptional regulator [Vibrio coralliilyticus]